MKFYRLKICLTTTQQAVDYDYYDTIRKFFHKVIGSQNRLHDSTSLYSLSSLYNESGHIGFGKDKKLLFDRDRPIWYISTPDLKLFIEIKNKMNAFIGQPFGYGMKIFSTREEIHEIKNITELTVQTSPLYLGQNPLVDGKVKRDHLTFNHPKELTTEKLKSCLKTKASKLGYVIKDEDFDIVLLGVDEWERAHTKRILINNHSNITSRTKIKITGTPEVIGLCCGFGLGLSTGCGFGFVNIPKIENLLTKKLTNNE